MALQQENPFGISRQLLFQLACTQATSTLVQVQYESDFISELEFVCKSSGTECAVVDSSLFVGFPHSNHKIVEDQVLATLNRPAVVVLSDLDVILNQLDMIGDSTQSRKGIEGFTAGLSGALKFYFSDRGHRVIVPVKSIQSLPVLLCRSFVDTLDFGGITLSGLKEEDSNSHIPTYLTSKGQQAYMKERSRSTNAHMYADQSLQESVSLACFQATYGNSWFRFVSQDGLASGLDNEEQFVAPLIALTASSVRRASQSRTLTQVKQTKDSQASTDTQVSAVRWADIGGLESVRKEVMNLIQLPITNPTLFPRGCPRRRGLLLFGPPGNGKTLVAKAIATETQRSFISVKGPELLNMYVGESERNVRELFAAARASAPCVLFFDELDSLVPKKSWSAGGASDRVVAQLVTEIDGVSDDVFLIGATNRPDIVDPSLLTPGRFDRKVYLAMNTSTEAKMKIFSAQMRSFALDDDVDLRKMCEVHLPGPLTGADVYDVTSRAYAIALARKLKEVDSLLVNPHKSSDTTTSSFSEKCQRVNEALAAFSRTQLKAIVRQSDLVDAALSFKPSVSDDELLVYERIAARLAETV